MSLKVTGLNGKSNRKFKLSTLKHTSFIAEDENAKAHVPQEMNELGRDWPKLSLFLFSRYFRSPSWLHNPLGSALGTKEHSNAIL